MKQIILDPKYSGEYNKYFTHHNPTSRNKFEKAVNKVLTLDTQLYIHRKIVCLRSIRDVNGIVKKNLDNIVELFIAYSKVKEMIRKQPSLEQMDKT